MARHVLKDEAAQVNSTEPQHFGGFPGLYTKQAGIAPADAELTEAEFKDRVHDDGIPVKASANAKSLVDQPVDLAARDESKLDPGQMIELPAPGAKLASAPAALVMPVDETQLMTTPPAGESGS